MGITENPKLIYQLSRLFNNGITERDLGVFYPKEPLMDIYRVYNIWVKRAFKKGYVDLVEESSDHWLFKINDLGISLLKKYKSYYLQTSDNYSILKTNNKKKISLGDEIKKARRRERRRLRKLRQQGIVK